MQFLKVTFLVPNLDERFLFNLTTPTLVETRAAVPQGNILSFKFIDDRCLFNLATPTLVERTRAAVPPGNALSSK